MKTIRYLNQLLTIGLIIFSCFIFTPQPANANTIDTLGKVLDLIHPIDSDIPSGSELSGLMGLIQDIANDPDHTLDYIADPKYSAVLQGNNYGDTVVMVAQLFVDVENTDVWGIVGIVAKWLGDDAPCIIAAIVLPGVGGELCDLVKEIVGFLADIGGAIADFFESIGDAIVCAFKKCCIGGQALYNRQTGYILHENDGLKWREDPAKDTFWDNEATLSNWVCDANDDACLVDLQNAQNAFIAIVSKKWDADMMTRVLPNIVTPARNAYNNQDQITNFAAQAAAATASKGDAGQWIIDRCTNDFSQYAYFDRWVEDTGNKAQAGKNTYWCSSIFWGKNKSKFAEKIGKYVNQNVCPNFLCGTVANYKVCSNLAHSVSGAANWQCKIDSVSMGSDMAPMINTLLHQAVPAGDGSQIPCTVDKNSVVCQRGTQQLFCGERYKAFVLQNLNFVMASLQGTPIVNCTFVEQGIYLDTHNKLKALYANPKSPFYGLVGDNVDPMRVAYIEPLTPFSDKNANPQLISNLQNDPAYKALGFVTKNCKRGEYIIDGEPVPTICTTPGKMVITTPGGSPEDKLKKGIEQLKHPGPDPRTTIPDISNISSYDGKTLKNGDTLKVINGQVFIRTKSGSQVAVRDQVLELQNGEKISVKGGKSIQAVKPGMNLNR
jgi:hypothetical protein